MRAKPALRFSTRSASQLEEAGRDLVENPVRLPSGLFRLPSMSSLA